MDEFCGDCNPMTDDDDGIWTATVTLPEENYRYKFKWTTGPTRRTWRGDN